MYQVRRLARRWSGARVRVRHDCGTTVFKPAEVPGVRGLAAGATLLQFSTEVCAPCRSTRVVLVGIKGVKGCA